MPRAKQEVSLVHRQQRPGVVFSFIFMKYVITAAWKRDKPQSHHPFAFFLLPVLHFKLIQTDFPPSSVSSFTILPQRFQPCYLHFFVLPVIHPSLLLQPSAFSSAELSLLQRSSPIHQPNFPFQNFLGIPIKYFKIRTS